jgi:hypothetical protein
MKAGTKKVKNAATGNVIVITGCVIALVVLMIIVAMIHKRQTETVAIIQAKETINVNALITDDFIQKYDISKVEFDASTNKYAKWEDKDDVINHYATVYTKANSYLYEGDVSDTAPLRNEYFVDLEPDDLLVTLPYDNSVFGSILVPRDYLKINVTYQPEDGAVDAAAANTTVKGIATSLVTRTIFEKLKVIDMLNASGNSVYDYYQEYLAASEEGKQALLADSDFVKNITPSSLVLSVKNQDEFDTYALVKNISGLSYSYGLYPRKNDDGTSYDPMDNLRSEDQRTLSEAIAAQSARQATEKGGTN